METWQIEKLANIYALIAEMEGMKALNIYRESRGETIAYDDTHFQGVANQLNEIAEFCRQYG